MQQPLVSILIPVYNADKKIAKAILSCIKQTYANKEIIVLNDGSTDFTIGELAKYSMIRTLKHDKNLGMSVTRNHLLMAANGEYIAWLDADDTMVPDRIERQVKFLQKHPDVDVVGSWVLTNNNAMPKKKVPTDRDLINTCLWFKNCLIHSSIMSRNFYVKENIFYDSGLRSNAGDSEIWYRLRKTKVMVNMPFYLTSVNQSTVKETQSKQTVQNEEEFNRIWEARWQDSTVHLDANQKKLFQLFLYNIKQLDYHQLGQVKTILNKISTAENKLVIQYLRLHIYVRMNIWYRLLNPDLWSSLFYLGALKRNRLV